MPGEALLRLLAIFLAMSIIIGIGNLLLVHVPRLARGRVMSGVLIASFGGTIAWHITQNGDTSLLETVQLPIESALAALLCVTLVAGGARILSKRADIWGLLFVAVTLVVILGSMPLPEVAPISALSDWLMRIPRAGGRARHPARYCAGQRRSRRPRAAGARPLLPGLADERRFPMAG